MNGNADKQPTMRLVLPVLVASLAAFPAGNLAMPDEAFADEGSSMGFANDDIVDLYGIPEPVGGYDEPEADIDEPAGEPATEEGRGTEPGQSESNTSEGNRIDEHSAAMLSREETGESEFPWAASVAAGVAVFVGIGLLLGMRRR